MRNSELPLVSFIKWQINPAVTVLTLALVASAMHRDFSGHYIMLAIVAFFISAQVFEEVDLFQSWRMLHFAARGRDLLIRWLIVISILLFIGYLTKFYKNYDQRVILWWFLLNPLMLMSSHLLARLIIYKLLLSASTLRSAVIVGLTDLGYQLGKQIQGDPYLCMSLKGYFDDRDIKRLKYASQATLLGHASDLPEYVKQHSIKLIFITLPMAAQPRIMHLLDELKDTTASVYFVPDIFVFDLIQSRFLNINGIPAVSVCETPLFGVNGMVKRLADFILASLILIGISPILLVLALGVKLSSPGPVIFKQRRYGLDGEEILVYKFRSMTVCEDGSQVVQARKDDQRITPLGAFMRKTSLDELPQFINVLQGRMSIVGPRPHAVSHNEAYRRLIKGYMVRHKVKPGITGWAQVNGLRGETETLDKMEQRVRYDLDYLRSWSLSLDMWIIARTILLVFKDKNAY